MGPDTNIMARPNFLIFMVDQLSGCFFPDGPADWLHVPNLAALAERSTRFANCYCASPLCSPARASFMSGLLPSRTGVYDNAAEFASDIPTFAHHLRRAGYHTCLAGKMHFVGPDQLHGFEERLTTDVYPADFGWTPDYRSPGKRIDWWYHNLGSVVTAGVAETTNQLEFDDEVAYHAKRKIHDLARGGDDRPWCVTVSFTHPHDPYVARRKYWDLYEDCQHLLPAVPALDYSDLDNHSARIFDANDWRQYDITDDDIRRSRRGYFAAISYLDEKIGEILDAVEATGQSATILFLSDHGDMLGERGLWFKMSFFDGSSRVPLMISSPSMAPGCVTTPVSALDVAPTLCALAHAPLDESDLPTDGEDLVAIIQRGSRLRPVAMEYAAEASCAPMVSLRVDRWKYNRCAADPEQLFDMDADPHELSNLAAQNQHGATLARLRELSDQLWDIDRFDAEVRQSQARRHVVYQALRNGAYFPWDHQPLQKASERYMRNHLNLDDFEARQRVPQKPE